MKYEFDDWLVCLQTQSLICSGNPVELEPRVFQLLKFFCEHPNQAVTRSELVEAVWQGRIVSDAAVNRAISELRKVLDKTGDQESYIKTISKVGYQFVALPSITKSDTLSHTKSSDKIPLGNVFAGLFLLAVLALFLLLNLSHSDFNQLQIVEELPVTSNIGQSYKAVEMDNGDLLYLYRKDLSSNAEVWLTSGNESRSLLEGEYYTGIEIIDNQRFIATRFNNLKDRECEIIEYNIEEGSSKVLFSCAQRSIPIMVYSASHNSVFFTYRDSVSHPYFVMKLHLATGRTQQVSFPDQEGNTRGDYLFAMSPDKKQLVVFGYNLDHASDVRFIDLDSFESTSIQTTIPFANSLIWDQRNSILFGHSEGISQLNLLDNSQNAILVGDNLGLIRPSAGKDILFSRFQIDSNLFVQEVSAAHSGLAVTQSLGVNWRPLFANNSNRFAYATSDRGATEFVITDESGKKTVVSPQVKIRFFNNIDWSPTDDKLLVTINGDIYSFDLTTSTWTKLAIDHRNVHFAVFLSETEVVFSSEHSGDWQLWRSNITTGETKQLTSAGGYVARLTNDNNGLLVQKFSQNGLFYFDLQTSDEKLLYSDFPMVAWRNWQVLVHEPEQLLWLREGKLFNLDYGQGTINQFENSIELPIRSFTISADGEQLVYEIFGEARSNIWRGAVREKN